MTPREADERRLEMLLESALGQVCSTITTRMVEPDAEMQARLRDQIRVALFCARLIGRISRNRARHAPAVEVDMSGFNTPLGKGQK